MNFCRIAWSLGVLTLCFLAGHSQPLAQTRPTPPAASDETPRFLLQVGIEAYPQRPLRGCLADLKDLREVLETRFAAPKQQWQVVTLVNEQATRAAILAQFRAHLIENARKYRNAVVVFQFSGHGSQIPDQPKGDEPDGYDETLVPWDSRNAQNGVTDITDDELNQLVQELRRYTPNIILILDSCHSGTAARDGSDQSRWLAPDKRARPVRAKRQLTPDVPNADMLPAGQGYVLLAGALSDEAALETDLPARNGVRRGVFTYHLVQALRRADNTTTYRRLMAEVGPAVARERPQHPQAEGALDRYLFGGTAAREEWSIPITALEGTRLTLGAGAAAGLQEGMTVAVYAPRARRLRGDQDRLAFATVTHISNAVSAQAELSAAHPDITTAARVVPVSPLFGLGPVRVLNQAGLAPDFAPELIGDGKITLVTATPQQQLGATDYVALRRGKFGTVFQGIKLETPEEGETHPAPAEEVYYLERGNGPEFGFYARAQLPDAPQLVAEALAKLLNQRNLMTLTNARAPQELSDSLKITVLVSNEIRETSPGSGQGVLVNPKVLATQADTYLLPRGQYFQIKLENLGRRSLYVTLFNLSTNGSITAMYPLAETNEALAANGGSVLVPAYETKWPAGSETVKAVITLADESFLRRLEQSGVTSKDEPLSPLQQLVGSAWGKIQAKGSRLAPNETPTYQLDDWATKQITLRVTQETASRQ